MPAPAPKYYIKLMDTDEEIAVMLAREKDAAIRLAAAVGASAHGVGCVTSNLASRNSH
ncbi:hypothetical protein F441_10783 [Phytophthora nicotianae CJ01A1]|uniref:Uncharacterized protein n=3 Tax=Phytophthora nicotianae TaxID=4792 RepID=V9EYW4_PHYNI|nr:hypothetical protein F443_10859 [Phytophthora nicotianae P1569]ETL37875.1 hypothetical protein L916_10485 [Phytophthora nicotianae]ETM44301.1 hypothetical protein L914_10444 [Phytophthora nicotianae]ETP14262.1 hypothetical protein F441_10783 [Phytophthora nicotianae CJ01A1]